MADEKQKMTSSYKAVFVFSIIMSVLMFVLYSAEYQTTHKASSTAIPFLLWCYQAWLIYKQQNAKLVGFYKAMLWIGGIALAILSLMLASNTDIAIYGFDAPKLIGIAVMLGIYYGLLQYFKQQLVNPSVTSATSNNSNASNEDYLRAEAEFNSSQRDAGLWVRCFAEADGNEAIAKARYIKNRASQFTSNSMSKNKDFEDSNTFIINIIGKLAMFGVAGFFLYVVYVVCIGYFGLPSTDIVSKITGIVSKKEEFYDVSFCTWHLQRSNQCEIQPKLGKAKFNVDKQSSQVIITTIRDDGKKDIIEKLENCAVVDEKNWKCGGELKTDNSIGSGYFTHTIKASFQSNNGEITTSAEDYKSYEKYKLTFQLYSDYPIYTKQQ